MMLNAFYDRYTFHFFSTQNSILKFTFDYRSSQNTLALRLLIILMKLCSLTAECFVLVQVLRVNSHSQSPKRTLFVCRHGERMDVVFGKHWLSQCSDAKGSGTYTTRTLPHSHIDKEWLQSNLVFGLSAGRYVRSNLNMPPFLPAWGGNRDYDMDAPITVFGEIQARTVGMSELFVLHF